MNLFVLKVEETPDTNNLGIWFIIYIMKMKNVGLVLLCSEKCHLPRKMEEESLNVEEKNVGGGHVYAGITLGPHKVGRCGQLKKSKGARPHPQLRPLTLKSP